MENLKINQKLEDYERVQKTFKELVHAIVLESLYIDGGAKEEEINEHIAKYCNTHGEQMIALIHDSAMKFVQSLQSHQPRYEVHCYEVNENGDCDEQTAKHFENDNEVIALKKAAEFYRYAKCPQVNIYDNKLDKYIAEWD